MIRLCAALLRAPRSAAAALLVGALAIGVLFNVRRWNDRDLLRWDSDCYYLYLPAVIIHHDPFTLRWLEDIPPGRMPEGYRFGYGLHPGKDADHRCNKCTLGVALSELPFFLVAHAWMRSTDPTHADGYAPLYQLSVGVASAVWATLGLLVLARFLRRRCSDAASAATVLALGLGTNLFFYASYAGGMAHPWLFFLTALLLERTDRWHTHQHPRHALQIGLVIGLAVLTRPTLALLALVPLTWHAAAPRLLLRHARSWALAAAVGALCLLPQLLYWKAATGHWLHYSYGDEGFDLAIRFGPLSESTLVARRLTTASMGLYAAPEYLARRGVPADPDGLGEHDLLVFAPVPRLATWTLHGDGGPVELVPTSRLTSNNLLAIYEAARAGAGVAFIPGFVLRCLGGSESLVPVLPGWRSATIDLFAVYPSGRNLAPKVRLYLDFLAAHLAPAAGL